MFNFFSEITGKFADAKKRITPYQIVMVGDFLMYIEGKISLMTLGRENIVFKVADGVVIISGKDLTVKDISKTTLVICGKISSWEKI